MGYKIAVIGATGNVGREMLRILDERKFPADEVVALASARSVGREVSFGEKTVLKVQDLAKFDFKGTHIALSSPGAKVSAEHSPRAAARHGDPSRCPAAPRLRAGRAGQAGADQGSCAKLPARTDPHQIAAAPATTGKPAPKPPVEGGEATHAAPPPKPAPRRLDAAGERAVCQHRG